MESENIGIAMQNLTILKFEFTIPAQHTRISLETPLDTREMGVFNIHTTYTNIHYKGFNIHATYTAK